MKDIPVLWMAGVNYMVEISREILPSQHHESVVLIVTAGEQRAGAIGFENVIVLSGRLCHPPPSSPRWVVGLNPHPASFAPPKHFGNLCPSRHPADGAAVDVAGDGQRRHRDSA